MRRDKVKAWFSAFRLRTLALSFALIIMGTALAYQGGSFSWRIFFFALLTTLFLQILSNLCNDYGDTVSGVDQAGRVGPARAVQSGAISREEMVGAMKLFGVLSLLSGVSLLMVSYPNLGWSGVGVLFAIGLLSIVAAVTYTVGKRPYGYMGLGDLSVFIFFGLVGVSGSNALYTGCLSVLSLIPASAVGLLSIGVLNMNNLRDYESDWRSGKNTLVVRFGQKWSRRYQAVVVLLAWVLLSVYIGLWGVQGQWLSLLALPIFVKHLHDVLVHREPSVIDAQLKKVSVGTMLMSLLFAVGTVVSA